MSLDGPEKRYLERPATYQVSVQNPGTAPAHDIELVTKLPKGMKFVKANNMGQYDAATHAVYWSLAELAGGREGNGRAGGDADRSGRSRRSKSRARRSKDSPIKRSARCWSRVLSAIMFEVRDTEDPIEVNGETTYEIRVVNQGSKAATNVQVLVSLPPGCNSSLRAARRISRASAAASCSSRSSSWRRRRTRSTACTVKGVQPGDQRVTVQVNTDDISQPIRREESTRVFGDQ